MKTKLTLSIDEELVQYAHRQAHQSGQSISDMVGSFLLRQKQRSSRRSVPTIDEMAGSLSKYSNIDYSKAGIREAYAQKYLR